jgi:hypothetical protein
MRKMMDGGKEFNREYRGKVAGGKEMASEIWRKLNEKRDGIPERLEFRKVVWR